MPYSPGSNTGHGHIWERPDGIRARCGGPRLCKECARDYAQKMRALAVAIRYEDIMKILEEKIVGDGQGYPDQGEREEAANAIFDLLRAHGFDVVKKPGA